MKIKIFLIVILLLIEIIFLIPDNLKECNVGVEEKIVRGNSLTGLIENGETVKILFGYYDCNPIEREDIVAYNYKGNKNLIVKIVKGLPGDRFELKRTREGWNILINNETLKNSEGENYLIESNKYELLSLYGEDYDNLIPNETYLILGNLVSGSVDSTKFGLVDRKDILGKVVR